MSEGNRIQGQDDGQAGEEARQISASGERTASPGERKAKLALITGGSRGIGAETALALAEYHYDTVFTYRNKTARANEIVAALAKKGSQGLALPCDLTHTEEIQQFFQQLKQHTNHLDALVLNASGGLEREIIAVDPYYPMRINRDAQLLFIDAALPFLSQGSTIVFVTSHWAHLYEQIQQFPAYEPIARSKHAGEQALRARQHEFDALGIRFVVVTGDLIEGTVTPKLLERVAPNLIEGRRAKLGSLPTAADMGKEIALTVVDTTRASGSTVAVGEDLQSLLSYSHR